MKLKKMILVGLGPLILSSCATENGVYAEPLSVYERIGGTWNLSRVRQVDELAVASKSGTTEQDLSGFFNEFSISLNENDKNSPTTFTTENSMGILPGNGYWKLDRAFQNWDGTPLKVMFYSDAAYSSHEGFVTLTATPGSVPLMELTLTRKTKETPFVSYVFTLIPVTSNN